MIDISNIYKRMSKGLLIPQNRGVFERSTCVGPY